MQPILSYIGKVDPHGHEFRVQALCVADELTGAAELVKGNLSRVPLAVVRGYEWDDEPTIAPVLATDEGPVPMTERRTRAIAKVLAEGAGRGMALPEATERLSHGRRRSSSPARRRSSCSSTTTTATAAWRCGWPPRPVSRRR